MSGVLSVIFLSPTCTIYFLKAKSYIFSGFSIITSSLSEPGISSLITSIRGCVPFAGFFHNFVVVLIELYVRFNTTFVAGVFNGNFT